MERRQVEKSVYVCPACKQDCSICGETTHDNGLNVAWPHYTATRQALVKKSYSTICGIPRPELSKSALTNTISGECYKMMQLLKQAHPDQSGSLERNAEILAAPANWTSRWKPPGEPHPTCKRHRGSQDLCQGHVQMCPGIGCRKFCSMTI